MLMTVKQIAETLGVAQSTIYKWVHEERIPYVRLGFNTLRFEKEKVLQAIEK